MTREVVDGLGTVRLTSRPSATAATTVDQVLAYAAGDLVNLGG